MDSAEKMLRGGEVEGVRRQMLRAKKGEVLPEGAQLMTEEEVLQMQMNIITHWKPRSEMWPFSYGIGILGAASALTGTYINNHCRSRLGLMSLARLGTFGPTVGLSVVTSSLFHLFMVTNKILIGDFPCTVCAATRSGALQSAFGALYPLVLAPLVCVANARKHHTYNVPSLRGKGEFAVFIKHLMPKSGVMLGMVLANFAIGMAVSERETLTFAKHLSPSSQTAAAYEKPFDDDD